MLKYNTKWQHKINNCDTITIGQVYDYGNGLLKYFVVPVNGSSSLLMGEEYVREHYVEYKESL